MNSRHILRILVERFSVCDHQLGNAIPKLKRVRVASKIDTCAGTNFRESNECGQ